MGESFEAKLIAAASKEVFKKAKQIIRGDEVLCCHESTPGTLRVICRDAHGFLSRAELRGFPDGPFSGSCNCNATFRSGICPHAMAAALYHAKYTIKYREEESVHDTPAQYAGLKFAGLPQLLNEMLVPAEAWIEINAESEFPHVPSKWERVPLSASLHLGKRSYYGNLNNMRQLYFNKNLAAALQLSSFSLQDRQIIRYLAINAQQDGTKLQLDAEQCAEFFHCLAGFQNFKCMGEKVVVHRTPATPLLLLERLKDGFVLKSAIATNGAPLPLSDVKVITGRNGCWVGMLGEYWWIPAQTEVTWLRSFLRTTVQPCDQKAAQTLYAMRDKLPIRIVASNNVKVRQRSFKTLYDGILQEDGSLALELLFDYDHQLYKADQARLAALNGNFIRRNSKAEFEAMRELVNFGFEMHEKKNTRVFTLKEKEAIGMFVDEVIPRWLREQRPCLLSSSLANLCGDSGNLKISCKVAASTPDHFDLAITLTAAGVPVRWRDLTDAALKNEFFMTSPAVPGVLIKIPAQLRLLAASLQTVTTPLADDFGYPGCDMLRIPRPAAVYWANTGADIPGAVPLEFLKIKVDLDTLAKTLEEPDAAFLENSLFTGTLRQYQLAGVCWLKAMGERGCNVILADEMGLGKTIQSIALLAGAADKNLPALIVAPTSLVDNWEREIRKFAPSLRVVTIAGPDRKELWKNAMAADICLCSYALAKRDAETLRTFHFRYLILDEAQHIKNPSSINAQTCKEISADHKVVLTGTPLENSAEDLWSIFDFLHPGLLGSLRAFRARYADIAKNHELGKELSRIIAPFILRRKKSDVCAELPGKLEQALYCDMDNGQLELYRKYEAEARQRCSDLKNGGSRMEMLTALLRLRQICCDPALLGENHRSAKFELLQELLLESLDSGRKVLVFSQFTSMLKIIRTWLESAGIPYEYLDGSTKDRMERVDAFNNSPDIPVFLLSLKAGGLGLNLTTADTVILYDPWWNPAAEAQAMDRSHRIGQTRNVTCFKLFVRGSVEEKVLSLQKKKQDLFGALVEDSAAALGGMTLEDFEFLLK